MTTPAGLQRRARKSLTQTDVVRAAAVVAERGVADLTMAKVAAELDVTAMALYQHVLDKTQLLSLLMDSMLAGIEVPPPSSGNWEARLRRLHRDITDAMTRFPGLVSLVRDLEHAPRLMEGYFRILFDSGFSPATAASAYTGLYYLAMGAQHPYHGEFGTPAAVAPSDPRLQASVEVAAAIPDTNAQRLQYEVLDIYLAGLRSLRRAETRR